MTDKSNTEQVSIRLKEANETAPDDYGDFGFQVQYLNYELFQEKIEEFNFSSDSAAARYFMNIGMRAASETHPKNGEYNSADSDDIYSIRDFVPEGRENAADMKEDELIERIESELLDAIDADPQINRDNFEVWK